MITRAPRIDRNFIGILRL